MVQITHVIHETIGDWRRRDRRNSVAILWTIAIIFLLFGFIGGMIYQDFKTSFWSLIVSLVLFWLGKALDRMGRKPRGTHTISYD